MNILKEYTQIYGEIDSPQQNWSIEDFFKIRNNICQKLGKKAYLLDDYISNFLNAANATLINTVVEESSIVTSNLWRICISIIRGEETDIDHSFYKNAKHFIDNTHLPFQEESTKVDYCFVHLFESFLLDSIKEFEQNQEECLLKTMDIVYFRHSYTNLVSIIGSEIEMEQLNLLLKQKFLYITSVSAFIQGVTHELVHALCHRDLETGKCIFQLECKE